MGRGQKEAPLATELQRAILESGMSLNQVGKHSGVSQGQLSRFVRGDRTLTLPAVDKLCRFFGLKLVREARIPGKDATSKLKGA
jgi:transcriptional regulator with XRE-family HTH domain